MRCAQKTSYNIDVFQKCLKNCILLYLVSNTRIGAIFNVIEYNGGDFVVGLVNNVPTGDLRLGVMLNDAAFKVFELFLAAILCFFYLFLNISKLYFQDER